MPRLTSTSAFLIFLAVASCVLYLGYSLHYGFIGFPLDDAWIHQTFARNLGLFRQFAYNLGEPSMGSTSPLWTILLSPAYALRLEPRLWTYLLGMLFLVLTARLLLRLSGLLFPDDRLAPLLTAAFCLLEWHLAWAAFSGMETIFFVFLSLLVLERHLEGERPLLIGLLGGLLTLTRPEGAVLLLLLMADTVWRRLQENRTTAWRSLAPYISFLVLGFLVAIVPYVALNISTTGNLFPNTFYAKQAEYGAVAASLSLWARWARVASTTVIGAQILLVPGCLYAAYRGLEARDSRLLLPLAWWFALVTLYALRLPVTYQHGRYLMPAIPMLLLLGVGGTRSLPRLHRIPKQVLFLSIPLLLVAFWFRGAEQYATDVRIIDSELQAAGLWLRNNTPRTAIIGAHDIGAIGHFSQRYLIDTAGLITPEVIPFIRDEDTILAFLEEKEVGYVAIFPSWYPAIADDPRMRPVYQATGQWVVEAGGDNIVVYQTTWHAPR